SGRRADRLPDAPGARPGAAGGAQRPARRSRPRHPGHRSGRGARAVRRAGRRHPAPVAVDSPLQVLPRPPGRRRAGRGRCSGLSAGRSLVAARRPDRTEGGGMSGKPALRFRRLELRRTPGIQTHFTLDGLCDGINITYGPNASGKTTTALALQMLLWPDFDGWERASLAGHLELQGSQWHIEVDSGEVVCRQDGSPGARLPIDADEYRDRYVLTLHDLLQAEDADFAGTILRESSGGYDVEAARQELGYRARPSRPSGNIRRRNQARKRRQEALRTQHELLREQMQLSELREQLDAARRASGEAEVLRKALVAHAHRRDLKQAQDTLELLPKGTARLRGDELERLDDIRARRDGYEDRRRQALADIEQAE